ncbi:ATP-dependent zinc metalloprotease FtsH [Patescibacteria group bacterium]|nr:ATP-dependent zinc metalloprotease FtsH [Patescibacteria group bacterium]MBU2036028.1 ATP-dependent zinc metalloprotease FtsH [Patescibacteria group bacterium]
MKKKQIKLKIKLDIKKVLLALFILFFLVPFVISMFEFQSNSSKLEISQAMSDIKAEKVKNVTIDENKVVLTYEDDSIKSTNKESTESFTDLLDKFKIDPNKVSYNIVDKTISDAVGQILGVVLPIALMAVFFLFIFKSQNKGAQDIFSFGKSKAKLFAKGKQSVTFQDVAGVDDAKKELEEVVDFLKNPAKYRRIGARTPKGVLLFGAAGVGKTLLARAVAGEAGVPFFSMAGSEFMEMLVGVGASRVRDLFVQAKLSAPSIIFIDEIDAIGRQRGRGMIGGHDEREQTLNQILVEMDGFTPNDNVMVIAATNRGDLLDPALLRPGRFDRRVTLDMPDKEGRLAILKIHSRGKKFAKGIGWIKIADRTVGFSGADLENMLNEAAIHAAREAKVAIEMGDVEEAATKVKLGPAKKRLQTDEDRQITAYHEAGHALTAHFLPKTDPVQRISIVARGMSLGHTEISSTGADRTHETKTRLLQAVTAMLGGRAAERLIFDEMTAGAASDIKNATKIARAMVVDFGMSNLGPVNLGANSEYGEFGSLDFYEGPTISPATQEKIDNEVNKIIDGCYKNAEEILKKNKKLLDKVVEKLLIKETLDKDDFEKIVGKKDSK